MQFDFRNPPQWLQPWTKFYDETIEFASWTETIGFDDIWVSEHHGAEDGYMPSVLIAATAIARNTERARIGTRSPWRHSTIPFASPRIGRCWIFFRKDGLIRASGSAIRRTSSPAMASR
jgi:hypothetical protein